MRQDGTPHPSQPSVSAALAAASHAAGQDFIPGHHDPDTHGVVRFPGDDAGNSLADMAQRDLDAALQLLADRAQYITGAGGAAIALRRNGKNDLLCRASAGSNAPELGALLSTEYGLSGESVRTRRALRCDDAERDARVNREVCRELGIASVVVMPVVDDDQVLGVFELFSGKAHAFGDRDMSALERLSQMVETAVRMARVAEMLPERLSGPEPVVAAAVPAAGGKEIEEPVVEVVTESAVLAAPPAASEPVAEVVAAAVSQATPSISIPPSSISIPPSPPAAAASTTLAVGTEPPRDPAKAKPLFWSVALSGSGEVSKAPEDQSHVPPMLRDLHKCDACGFPVSAGRALCVECEEKKWRGQLKKPQAGPASTPASQPDKAVAAAVSASAAQTKSPPLVLLAGSVPTESPLQPNAGLHGSPAPDSPAPKEAANGTAVPRRLIAPPELIATKKEAEPVVARAEAPAPAPEFVFSAGLAPQQSWLSRNKILVAAIAIVAAAVVGFLLLHGEFIASR